MQSGPAAPIAGLPVMSELLKRMADLDEEEAGLLRSMGTAAPQVWRFAPSQSLLPVRRKRKKDHYIFSSQLRADQMPSPPQTDETSAPLCWLPGWRLPAPWQSDVA